MAREASDKEKVSRKCFVCLASCLLCVPSVLLKMCLFLKGKELPTFKDMDFRNNMQKVYVTDEQKEKLMEKLNRDVEVKLTLWISLVGTF